MQTTIQLMAAPQLERLAAVVAEGILCENEHNDTSIASATQLEYTAGSSSTFG